MRVTICYRVAGRRGLHAALPMLVHALNDPDSGVRCEAADSLGYIGDPSTGYDLFKRLKVEKEQGVRTMLPRLAVQHGLRPGTSGPDQGAGQGRPWDAVTGSRGALVHMGAKEALPALRQALAREASDWSGIGRCIDELEGG